MHALRYGSLQLAVALVYFSLAVFALFLTPSQSIGSTFYPAAGFALGIILALGKTYLFGVFVGALLTLSYLIFGVDGLTLKGLLFSTLFGGIITGQAWIAYALLRGYRSLEVSFVKNKVRVFASFVGATIISTLFGSLLSIVCLVMDGLVQWESALPFWLRWWSGDMLGIMFFTPLTLTLLVGFSDQNRVLKRVTLPLVLASIVIASLTYKVHFDQQEQVKQFISQKLEKFQAMLLNELIRVEEKVSAIGRFYESSVFVSPEEFQNFIEPQSVDPQFITGYSWNAVLRPEDVAEFELNLSTELKQPDFTIRQFDSNWGAVGKPDWHVVVERIYPPEQSQAVVGLDIMSEFLIL